MKTKEYTPRRANLKRWLAGAPDYVLDVFRNPAYPAEGLEVWLTLTNGGPDYASTWVCGCAMNLSGTMGNSLELRAYDLAAYRYRNARHRIPWSEVPEAGKQWVATWMNFETV